MRIINLINRLLSRARSDEGFTMIIALGVMFVTSLLLVAAYTTVNGDDKLSHNEILQKAAYYAAVAGVQEYEYQLQNNPDYWQTCKTPENTVPQDTEKTKENAYNGHYAIKLLPASTSPTKECSTSNPFGTMIQSGGALANTFRIESIGYAGGDKNTLIATFHVIGFLNYVYFTQYEDEDPNLNGESKSCEAYYAQRNASGAKCVNIVFDEEDSVNGPMHTDDAAQVECSKNLSFGRSGHKDVVEINGGTWPSCSKTSEPTYNNTGKKPTKGEELVAPQSDTSLLSYVEEENEFTGVTHLVLNGTTKKITAKYFNEKKEEVEKTLTWPKNGLIYVRTGKSCGFSYKQSNADTSTETSQETECGTVYVSGTYSEPLTIAAENDVIVNGNIYPTSVEGKLGSEPTGTTTLGLIATEYVRIYHPCGSKGNEKGYLENPWIYAAILSTSHSFLVDNYTCGKTMGKLNVYGAIAQKFRGIVSQPGESGYAKDYIYDERLATDEPPFFLSPLNAGWQVERETAPTAE
jgi:Tfp pilus assembly protein PilX